MHGMQHLYRQQAVDRQLSANDSWHSAQSSCNSETNIDSNNSNQSDNSYDEDDLFGIGPVKEAIEGMYLIKYK